MPINILNDLYNRHMELKIINDELLSAYDSCIDCYNKGGKMLLCGNGGSASDCDHIVGELMKGFLLKRPILNNDYQKIYKLFPSDAYMLTQNLQRSLPAISLVSQSALITAFMNDVEPSMIFAQQVYGYGRTEDILIGISTSGNSKNIINAVKIALVLEIKTIVLTGENGGELKDLCDVAICAPSNKTEIIQEYHIAIYHALCAMIEKYFFN